VNKPVNKSILIILSFSILILIAGYVVSEVFKLDLSVRNIAVILLAFTSISIVTIIVFFRGQTRDPESQTFHTLVAISLKFLLEIVFALCWFIFAKKNGFDSIIMFFVLYLCLSLFSIGIILKTLKNKAL
jgi:hypothetical protein